MSIIRSDDALQQTETLQKICNDNMIIGAHVNADFINIDIMKIRNSV
jgi:hypothetical protein